MSDKLQEAMLARLQADVQRTGGEVQKKATGKSGTVNGFPGGESGRRGPLVFQRVLESVRR